MINAWGNCICFCWVKGPNPWISCRNASGFWPVEDCTVLAVPKDEFVTLIKSHPETTMTLIDNMARNIQSLNARLTEE